MGLTIAAVIPCFNEGRTIAGIVETAHRFCDTVIVADDSSTDNTISESFSAGAIAATAHSRSRGAGANTRHGIGLAMRLSCDVIVTLDGDGQHEPQEIPILLQPLLDGKADIVVGSRFLTPGYLIPRYRKLGIDIITWALNLGASTKFTDGQSCYRAFLRNSLEKITITERGFGFSIEMLVKARAEGLRIVEVPVSCIYYAQHSMNSTHNPIRQGLTVLFKTLRWRVWEIAHSRTRRGRQLQTAS